MKIENYIRLTGIVLGIGILMSYFTLNNGFIFMRQGFTLSFLIGLAEILRWSLGLVAAILLFRLQKSARWILLLAFLFGLVGSWVSFIPFAGYLMKLTDPTSFIGNFIALQAPNLILIMLVFYLFSLYSKPNTTL